MLVQEFLNRIQTVYTTGNATEHSYRSAFEFLFDALDPDISALNEPKRVACGAPDFIINRGEITIGHIEAKDVPVGIRNLKDANKNQQERYLKALPNLIYTNGLDFDFYRDGERIHEISIADFVMGIQPKPENFEPLENLLRDFITQTPQTITSTRDLARRMAGKAALFKDVLGNALKSDPDLNSDLAGQYKAFKQHLIHDITPEDFADIYAETIAYGMFAARLHDETVSDFSRQEALQRLPRTYPFLRDLFSYIAGPNLDETIRRDVDDLAAVFQACDLHELMADFGKLTGQNDPFLHFYEIFLQEYNPTKRKARGVWYTPEPVVNFIVRAVDDVLQKEFGLPLGLADTSKVTIDVDTGQTDKKGKPILNSEQVHRVQILDPATGTGTFLAEVIKQIAPKVKGMAEGKWSGYVEKDLIPRLHGFELLMASYAMCHMKLDMVLTELGYKPSANPPRMSVYLTNSLEEGEKEVADLFMAQWLTREAREANAIKRDKPIMCVIGNPPYSGESANKGDWIMSLMEAYKKEPGGKEKLKEKNSKWINDDYVKFIRFAEHMIEKNGEGILGFITNHGYLDNPTFRGMRWHLLKTFDKIYVLDLHGNSLKKEAAPDGSVDKNVFDIMPGVAIIVGVKFSRSTETSGKSFELARLNHSEIWGPRQSKYESLWKQEIYSDAWTPLNNNAPRNPFGHYNQELGDRFASGFSIGELFKVNGNGMVTKRDALCIQESKSAVWESMNDFLNLPEQAVRKKYSIPDDVRDWKFEWAKSDVAANLDEKNIERINYRPFDQRYVLYTGNSRGFVGWPVPKVMLNYVRNKNIGLLAPKSLRDSEFAHCFVTSLISEAIFLSGTTGSNAINFPLYLYPTEQDLDQTRRVNFDEKIYAQIRAAAKDTSHGEPDEVAVFDYIYGVLHCPAYRETYKEFLKIDFPRVPYPTSPKLFWDISAKGTQLRRLHLMEPEVIGETPYPFKGEGDDVVEKPNRDDDGRVWINKTQHFENVPQIAWDFYIGGYQPAQKWLKDRKTRELSFDDVLHYQRIIKILSETDRIMKTIEMPLGTD